MKFEQPETPTLLNNSETGMMDNDSTWLSKDKMLANVKMEQDSENDEEEAMFFNVRLNCVQWTIGDDYLDRKSNKAKITITSTDRYYLNPTLDIGHSSLASSSSGQHFKRFRKAPGQLRKSRLPVIIGGCDLTQHPLDSSRFDEERLFVVPPPQIAKEPLSPPSSSSSQLSSSIFSTTAKSQNDLSSSKRSIANDNEDSIQRKRSRKTVPSIF